MVAKKNRQVGAELVRRMKRFAEQLPAAGGLEQRFTCRTVRLNLNPTPYNAKLVKKTRQLLQMSQPIFAQFLGVSASAVRDWEQGIKPPNGAARRMMDEIRDSPDHFLKRLQALSAPVDA